ncbi:MAG: STAS domain-containing protein [Candidatus Omnitrophota bacterium]
MPLKINIKKQQDEVFAVSPSGYIDSETYQDLAKEVDLILSAATKVIIFDMQKVEYISSRGITVLLETKKTLQAKGGTVVIINLQPQVKKALDIISAIPGFNIFASTEEADAYLFRIEQEEKNKKKPE